MRAVILVQGSPALESAPQTWNDHAFVHAVFHGQLHPDTPASVDGGRTWMAAWPLAQRLAARGDDGLAAVVPVRVESMCMGAGYIGLLSLLFFGGPISFAVAVAGFDSGPKITVRLAILLVGVVLGPLPVAAMALAGLRNLRRDPTLRGRNRAVFALVCAGLMALACFVGAVGIVVR